MLEDIIDNAQAFRTHVAPFCNPIMATSEEAETQRFYLRKIEGAEILLAYETNFFRQELHKWSPVAPEAPPVLDSSKSTRKPRPTKLQKLMAIHGVDDPEALPQAFRTKQHSFKRKSLELSTARPQPLQPAPGRSDSGTPTSHSFPTSGPAGLHHGPTLATDHHPSFAFDTHPYSMTNSQNSTPAFAPHAYLHGPPSLTSPPYGSASPRPADLSAGMFMGASLGRSDPAMGVTASLDSPMRDGFGGSQGGTNANIDKMFIDLTNQDDDGPSMQGDAADAPISEPPSGATAKESSQAEESEFLDNLGMYREIPYDSD